MGAIDADAHVIETPRTFDFLDADMAQYRPRVVAQVDGPEQLSNQGSVEKQFWGIGPRLLPMEGNIGSNTSKESRELADVGARLKHMDELEIDVQVLYPTLFLRPCTDDPTTELALCRAYNRWLADIWSKSDGRLRWVVLLPLRSMDRVREELEFGKANGACGIFLRGIEADMMLSNPYFFPLYEAAQDLDLAVCFHAGNGAFSTWDIYEREAGAFIKSKLAVVGACHDLIQSDLHAKFTKVRWAFVEVSAQWVPYMLNDLSIRMIRRGKRLGKDTLKEHNIWVACQVTDDLEYILKDGGEDNLVVGTDYGHADASAEIEAMRRLRDEGKVSESVAAKILEGNARVLYDL